MYKIGQCIIYGNVGVCYVRAIASGQEIGLEEGQYYVLDPLYENGTIYTPVNTTRIFTRPVISKDEVNALIDQIPQMQVQPDYIRSRLKKHA